jgi:hypothetical protein
MIELILYLYNIRKLVMTNIMYIDVYSIYVRYQQHSFLHVWNWDDPCYFFSILSHKKKIQLRKTKSLAAALLEAITFPRKYLCIFSKQHYYSYLKLQHKFNFCHNRVVLVTVSITFYNLWKLFLSTYVKSGNIVTSDKFVKNL